MKRDSSRAVREGALMTALTVIIYLVAMYLPFASTFAVFVAGTPLGAALIRNNYKTTLIAFFASFLLMFIIGGDIIVPITYSLLGIIPGVVSAYCLKEKKELSISVIITTFAEIIGIILCLGIFKLIYKQDILNDMLKEYFVAIEQATKNLPVGTDATKQVTDTVAQLKTTMQVYMPSLLILTSAIISGVILMINSFIYKRLRFNVGNRIELSKIKAPRSMGYGMAVVMLISLFIPQDGKLSFALMNIVYIFMMIMGSCGLSAVDYFLKYKKNMGKGRFIILLITLYFFTVLTITGLIDTFRDFRGLEKKEA